jgi:eukaryotic-like serine/threonine-protein kinase
MIDPNAQTTDGSAPATAAAAAAPADMPQQIGPYRILERLGQGGMGQVLLGESLLPKRKVAIKLMLGGNFSVDSITRFRREMEVMARLEHPGIARLYDVGTLNWQGEEQPWYAMEFVDGLPLDEYVSRRQRELRSVFKLTAQVARALQFAHQRGVIHRDIKPANIMVTSEGQAKILDFGIARLIEGEPQAPGAQTRFGQIIGTLAYMSPEQLSSASGADVRSDVYALGVVLYELLTGELPLKISTTSLLEAIKEVSDGKRKALSAHVPALRGEVELIVDTASNRELDARYESAASFATDLENYLDNRPLLAKRPSAAYVFGKFVRRNPLLVATIAVAVISLLGATTWSTIAAERARKAQASTEQRNREMEAVNGFVEQMLQEVNPDIASGAEVTMRQVLDNADIAYQNLPNEPGVRGTIALLLAAARNGVDDHAAALKFAQQSALDLQTSLGPTHAKVWAAKLAQVSALAAMEKLDEAIALADKTVAEIRASLGENTSEEAQFRTQKVYAMQQTDRQEEALAESEFILKTFDRQLRALPGSQYASVMHNHASMLQSAGRLPEAEKIYLQIQADSVAAKNEWNPQSLNSMQSLAALYANTGRVDEALVVSEKVIAGRIKTLGKRHPATLISEFGRVTLLVKLKQPERALAFVEELMPRASAVFDADSTNMIQTNLQYANVLDAAGRLPEAEVKFRALIQQLSDKALPPTLIQQVMNNLAYNLLKAGRVADSRAEFALLVAHSERTNRDTNPYAQYLSNAANADNVAGDFASAKQKLALAIPILLKEMPPESPIVVRAQKRLAAANARTTESI